MRLLTDLQIARVQQRSGSVRTQAGGRGNSWRMSLYVPPCRGTLRFRAGKKNTWTMCFLESPRGIVLKSVGDSGDPALVDLTRADFFRFPCRYYSPSAVRVYVSFRDSERDVGLLWLRVLLTFTAKKGLLDRGLVHLHRELRVFPLWVFARVWPWSRECGFFLRGYLHDVVPPCGVGAAFF